MTTISIIFLSVILIITDIQIIRIYKHLQDILDIEEKTLTLIKDVANEYARMREELTALKLREELDQLKSKVK